MCIKKLFFLLPLLVIPMASKAVLQRETIEELVKECFLKQNIQTQKFIPKSLKKSASKHILLCWEKYKPIIKSHPLTENSFDFEGLKISNIDFSGISLRGANFNKCELRNVNFENADLTDSTFKNTVFILNVKISRAILYKDISEEFKFNTSLTDIELIKLYSDLLNSGQEKKAAGLNKFLGPLKLEISDHSFDKLNLKGINLKNARIKNVIFLSCDLSYANLSNCFLDNVLLKQTNISGSQLDGVDLSRATFYEVIFAANVTIIKKSFNELKNEDKDYYQEDSYQEDRIYFIQETQRSVFHEWADALQKQDKNKIKLFKKLINSQFPIFSWIHHEELASIDWIDQDLHNADLFSTELHDLNFTGANLQKANLEEADLTNTILDNANLDGANISHVTLSDTTELYNTDPDKLLLKYLKNPIKYQKIVNANFNIFESISSDTFTGSELQGKNLRNANFYKVDLSKFDLSNTNLENANLKFANLNGANLSNANLRGANLTGANLIGANLTGSNLIKASLGIVKITDTLVLPRNWSQVNFNNLDEKSLKALIPIAIGINYQLLDSEMVEAFKSLYK